MPCFYLSRPPTSLFTLFFLAALFLGTRVTHAATPGGVSRDLILWLDASKGTMLGSRQATAGEGITQWRDQSPARRRDANQADSRRPILQSARRTDFNHHPALLFNDPKRKLTFGNDYVVSSKRGSPHGMTWFSVIKPVVNHSVYAPMVYAIGSWGNAGFSMLYDATKVGVYAKADGHHTQAKSHAIQWRDKRTTLVRHQIEFSRRLKGFIDGAHQPVVSIPMSTPALNTNTMWESNPSRGNGGPFTIGRGAKDHNAHKSYFPGDIAEIIGFDRVLSASETRQVESYLALKYGLTLGQTGANGSANLGVGDYVSSDGRVNYFAAPADTTGAHHHNIFGLGRDDGAGIHQKISRSTAPNAVLSVSLDGTFERANKEISGGFTQNHQFVMFSNNTGAPLDNHYGLNLPSNREFDRRSDRQWQIQRTNYMGDITLKFTGFGSEWVLVASGDSNFTSGHRVIGNLNTAGVIRVNNSHLPDKHYFTLMHRDTSLTTADKLVVQHDGHGVYYCAESVTISARKSDGRLATRYTGLVHLETDTGLGQWEVVNTALWQLTNSRQGDGVATYRFTEADQGQVQLKLIHPHGSASVDIRASDTRVDDDNSHSRLHWHTSGFNVVSFNTPNFSDVRAGEPQMAVLQAVNSDFSKNQCAATVHYSGVMNIGISHERLNPTVAYYPAFASSFGREIALPFDPTRYANVPLRFYLGSAILPWRYDDVGQMRFRVRDQSNQQMKGSSPAFVSRPYRLELTADNPGFSRTGAGRFAVAGAPFRVQLKSFNKSGGHTPSFGKESPSANVTLNTQIAQGDQAGTLTQSFSPQLGYFESTQTQYSEVGHIGLSATVHWQGVPNSYLGSKLDSVSHPNSVFALPDIGRFIPQRFEPKQVISGYWKNHCHGKSYLGDTQSLGNSTQVTLQALNQQGIKTRNYQFGHRPFHHQLSLHLEDENQRLADGSALKLTAPNTSMTQSRLSPGEATFDIQADYRHIMTSGHLQDVAPFQASVPLWLNGFWDDDQVALSSSIKIHPQGNQLYRARVRVPSGIASSTQPYRLEAYFEVYDGTQFVTDTTGGCGAIQQLHITPHAGTASQTALLSQWRNSIQPPISLANSFQSRLGVLNYRLPSFGYTVGSGRISARAEVPAYLKYAWQTQGALEDPIATIEYGTSKVIGDLDRGRVVFLQEIF